MSIVGIIPARYASTRFPGKPLAEIAGRPMIHHVYERACRSGLLKKCWWPPMISAFLTVRKFGGE